MLIITVLAVGFVAAALFSSRIARTEPAGLRLADERGITLQTLIVTAVLVLMAVAAGVVIVAITNSSSDDLEESGTDVQARCNAVEIYDPVVASRNDRGANFDDDGQKFVSPRIGCIPVCVWTNGATEGGTIRLDRGEVAFHRDASGIDLEITNTAAADKNYLIKSAEGGVVKFYDADHENHADEGSPSMTLALGPGIDRVAVAPNQNQCQTYDSGGEVLFP